MEAQQKSLQEDPFLGDANWSLVWRCVKVEDVIDSVKCAQVVIIRVIIETSCRATATLASGEGGGAGVILPLALLGHWGS